MAKSDSLRKAKEAKRDEFYTLLSDIEFELKHYKMHFKGKTVFCNCDDPFESNFFKYFAMNFNVLGLKKLIATCHQESKIAGTQLSLFDFDNNINIKKITRKAYLIELTEVKDSNGDGAINLDDISDILRSNASNLKVLKGDGDFRSDECIKYLKEADIVVTNPPFSLFREYVAQLIEYQKKFVIIGNINAISYKEIFPLIKDNKIWLGYKNGSQEFQVPMDYEGNNTYIASDGLKYAKFGNICWFTNLDIVKRHEKMTLYKKYDPKDNPTYVNYDAIDVNKTSEIPCDYYGKMGVPLSFLDKHDPSQFKIIGISSRDANKITDYIEADAKYTKGGPSFYIKTGDKEYYRLFTRLIIIRNDIENIESEEDKHEDKIE